MIGRRVQTVGEIVKPGDYCGPVRGYTADAEACFYLLPNAQPGDSLHHVNFPPHTYRECPDGSLEIRNSIRHTGFISEREPHGEWHGYLDEGHVWREVG